MKLVFFRKVLIEDILKDLYEMLVSGIFLGG